MKKMSHLFMLICLSVFMSACSSLSSVVEKPTLSIADIKPTKFGPDGQVFTVQLKVDNPNAFALPVNGLNYAFQLAGQDVASGTASSAVRIPARGNGIVELDLTANLMEVLPNIAKSLMAGEAKLNYGLKGDISLDNVFVKSIPFDKTGEIPFNPFEMMRGLSQ